ncbi:MAG: hypothetical protein ACE15D_10940 [Candidatus Eisenbacteria bacterium]
MSTAFLVLAVLCALWGVVNAILIVAALQRRGIHVNLLLLRLDFFRHLTQYRTLTFSETGRVGPLYYSYLIAMSVALLSVAIALILRVS